MSQHPVDLLPEVLRNRSQAGVRMGRYVAAAILSAVVLVVLATHSRLELERSRKALTNAREQADLVLATEARATDLHRMIAELNDCVDRYERIALPFEVTRVLATVINDLPEGMTLDRIDMDAGVRRAVRSARSRDDGLDENAPRILNVELSGFAPDDDAIARFVSKLESRTAYRKVSLDFSRTRGVRGVLAREFRLSFSMPLDVHYDVISMDEPNDELVSATEGGS